MAIPEALLKGPEHPDMSQGAALAQMRYKAAVERKKPGQGYANLIDDVTSRMKKKGSAGALRMVMKGVSESIREKGILEDEENYNRFQQTIGMYEKINMQSVEMKHRFEQERMRGTLNDEFLDSLQPAIETYVQNISQWDPMTRENYARLAIDDINRKTGTDMKYLSQDAVNPALLTVSQNGQTQVVDLYGMMRDRKKASNDQAKQNIRLASLLAQDQQERDRAYGLQKRQVDLHERQIEQQNQKYLAEIKKMDNESSLNAKKAENEANAPHEELIKGFKTDLKTLQRTHQTRGAIRELKEILIKHGDKATLSGLFERLGTMNEGEWLNLGKSLKSEKDRVIVREVQQLLKTIKGNEVVAKKFETDMTTKFADPGSVTEKAKELIASLEVLDHDLSVEQQNYEWMKPVAEYLKMDINKYYAEHAPVEEKVPMIGSDGLPYKVPKSKVQEVLNDGGRYA